MRLFKSFKKIVVLGFIGAASCAWAQGESLKFGLCYDLTKAYSFLTPQVAQAAKDYAALVNKNGGVKGRKVEILVEDHGNEPQRGIECYEKMRRAGVLTLDTLSSPVSRALLPRAMKDEMVLLQSFVGRSDAVDGDVFKWIFPIGPTYWGQAANDISYIKSKSQNSLKGVKVAFVYVDYAFGQEPIPVLKSLAAKEGFELELFPYPLPGNEQSSAWTKIRRFKPDWVIHWGIANMNVVAGKEMQRNGLPLDRFIAVNWMNESDINNMGAAAAKGLKRGTSISADASHPTLQRIRRDVYGSGLGSGDIKMTEDGYYIMGVAMYSAVVQAATLALEASRAPMTPARMKAGLESLKGFDAEGLMAPVTVTASDHGGGGKTRIDVWDGKKWVTETNWFSAYDDEVRSVVLENSREFVRSQK